MSKIRTLRASSLLSSCWSLNVTCTSLLKRPDRYPRHVVGASEHGFLSPCPEPLALLDQPRSHQNERPHSWGAFPATPSLQVPAQAAAPGPCSPVGCQTTGRAMRGPRVPTHRHMLPLLPDPHLPGRSSMAMAQDVRKVGCYDCPPAPAPWR